METFSDEQYIDTAIHLIRCILSFGDPTIESIQDLLEIQSGNKRVFKEHATAIRNILDKAISIIETEQEDNNSR